MRLPGVDAEGGAARGRSVADVGLLWAEAPASRALAGAEASFSGERRLGTRRRSGAEGRDAQHNEQLGLGGSGMAPLRLFPVLPAAPRQQCP